MTRLDLAQEDQEELRAELVTLQAQMASPRPRLAAVREAAAGIRDVLEGLARSGKAARDAFPLLERARALLDACEHDAPDPLCRPAGHARAHPDRLQPTDRECDTGELHGDHTSGLRNSRSAPWRRTGRGGLAPPLTVGPEDTLELVVVSGFRPGWPRQRPRQGGRVWTSRGC